MLISKKSIQNLIDKSAVKWLQMINYDAWKLMTPEEYTGAIRLICKNCGDDFYEYDETKEFCPFCEEDLSD